MSRLVDLSQEEGFTVETLGRIVRVTGIPCMFKDGVGGTCTIEKSHDPVSGKPGSEESGASHAVRVITDGGSDGLVYQADGNPIGLRIGGDGESWSLISLRKGGERSPQEDESTHELLYRYVKQIVGAVKAARHSEAVPSPTAHPFKIPYTFAARIGPVEDSISGQRIAIIGLGGTGSYILDLIAKTLVAEIHLLDGDIIQWHNLLRTPGAPIDAEFEGVKLGSLLKVEYLRSKYADLRKGIHPHQVDSLPSFRQFLAEHPIDYAFVSIGQAEDGSGRQDGVYTALSEKGIPFIDSGISTTLVESAVAIAVSTGFYGKGSLAWRKTIPSPQLGGVQQPGYRNVQLPEMNALAAALAVMEWRRRTGQYVSDADTFFHKLRTETPHIISAVEPPPGQP